ncbi:MAG: response regulator [Planctomycetota bacterium]|nr:MAG: response regulator [Planctomycetota bacterium]
MNRARILVVEDEPFIRELVRETLAFEPYEVLEASTGEEALSQAESAPPDVVLLDINLDGELDGIEVCKRLRQREPALPVIFLTAVADNAIVEEGMRAGACAYLTKPFSPLALIERVKAARGDEV